MAYDVLSARQLEDESCAFILDDQLGSQTILLDQLDVDWEQLPRWRRWTNTLDFWQGNNADDLRARHFLNRHGYQGSEWHEAGVQQLVEVTLPLDDIVMLRGSRHTANSPDGAPNNYRTAPQASVICAQELRWQGRYNGALNEPRAPEKRPAPNRDPG